jgi:hypothetical protein
MMNIWHQVRYAFRWFFQPHFIAGEKAENRFEQLCETHGYIVEKISQDRRHFAQYAANAQSYVKRGDYIVRNLGNIEVEVKCFSLRTYGVTRCYCLKYSHIKRHEEIERLTGAPVIFAVFERNGRNVVEHSLRMIPLRELTARRHKAVFYDKQIKCLCVPFEIMYPAFDCFERHQSFRRK